MFFLMPMAYVFCRAVTAIADDDYDDRQMLIVKKYQYPAMTSVRPSLAN